MVAEKAFFLNEMYLYNLNEIEEKKNDSLTKYLNIE